MSPDSHWTRPSLREVAGFMEETWRTRRLAGASLPQPGREPVADRPITVDSDDSEFIFRTLQFQGRMQVSTLAGYRALCHLSQGIDPYLPGWSSQHVFHSHLAPWIGHASPLDVLYGPYFILGPLFLPGLECPVSGFSQHPHHRQ